MRETCDHAVVFGASLAGLLTARVLADFCKQVTVVERDALPPVGQQRKGVPHGRHLHGLHPRGREILDEVLPGFTAELTAAGAVCCDVLADGRWEFSGHQLKQRHAGLPALLASRPFLEGHVRERVFGLPNIRVLDGHSVAGLLAARGGRRVTGARVSDAEGKPEVIDADLVVDASGRGSRTPRWLSELGYQVPAQDRVEIGLGYATRTYRLRPGAMNGDRLILTTATLASPRFGALAAVEGGRHMLTLGGICGDYPPTDPAGFADFFSALPTGAIAAAVAGAEPLDEAVPFRFPASTRNRYERLREFPAGLLVTGDAVCSFNPVYGQGMTVAAMQALALRRHIGAGTARTPSRFFKDIAAVIDIPWDIAVGADLAFPQVPGPRSAKVRFVNAYLPRLHAAAADDGELALAMIRVIGLSRTGQKGSCARTACCACCAATCADPPGQVTRPARGQELRRRCKLGTASRAALRDALATVSPAEARPPVTRLQRVVHGVPAADPLGRTPWARQRRS
jgi:2-polyprenyl-6-methoxyphenol hydroxylase-like FAD-dependent oxidoreductase